MTDSSGFASLWLPFCIGLIWFHLKDRTNPGRRQLIPITPNKSLEIDNTHGKVIQYLYTCNNNGVYAMKVPQKKNKHTCMYAMPVIIDTILSNKKGNYDITRTKRFKFRCLYSLCLQHA